MLPTLIIFIAILLVLILSHEAGHFFSARFFGVKVEEFGFGLPPRILGWQGKKTFYSLNWLPFGGFVKIFGEEGEDASYPESFGSKPAYKRLIILAAGILANIFLAYFAFSALAALGLPEFSTEDEMPGMKVAFVNIAPNSPAERAGLLAGDTIRAISSAGEKIIPAKISQIQELISKNKGKELRFEIERNGSLFEKNIYPREAPPEGEGPLGVSLGFMSYKKTPFYKVPIDGAKITWEAVRLTALGFYDMVSALFKGEREKVQVTGPVGIFGFVASAKEAGLRSLIMFLGLLSVNLAIINLLPIPGLDGGRIFFLFIESAKGKKISAKTSAIFHTTGLIILITLMLLVTYQDLVKVFSR